MADQKISKEQLKEVQKFITKYYSEKLSKDAIKKIFDKTLKSYDDQLVKDLDVAIEKIDTTKIANEFNQKITIFQKDAKVTSDRTFKTIFDTINKKHTTELSEIKDSIITKTSQNSILQSSYTKLFSTFNSDLKSVITTSDKKAALLTDQFLKSNLQTSNAIRGVNIRLAEADGIGSEAADQAEEELNSKKNDTLFNVHKNTNSIIDLLKNLKPGGASEEKKETSWVGDLWKWFKDNIEKALAIAAAVMNEKFARDALRYGAKLAVFTAEQMGKFAKLYGRVSSSLKNFPKIRQEILAAEKALKAFQDADLLTKMNRAIFDPLHTAEKALNETLLDAKRTLEVYKAGLKGEGLAGKVAKLIVGGKDFADKIGSKFTKINAAIDKSSKLLKLIPESATNAVAKMSKIISGSTVAKGLVKLAASKTMTAASAGMAIKEYAPKDLTGIIDALLTGSKKAGPNDILKTALDWSLGDKKLWGTDTKLSETIGSGMSSLGAGLNAGINAGVITKSPIAALFAAVGGIYTEDYKMLKDANLLSKGTIETIDTITSNVDRGAKVINWLIDKGTGFDVFNTLGLEYRTEDEIKFGVKKKKTIWQNDEGKNAWEILFGSEEDKTKNLDKTIENQDTTHKLIKEIIPKINEKQSIAPKVIEIKEKHQEEAAKEYGKKFASVNTNINSSIIEVADADNLNKSLDGFSRKSQNKDWAPSFGAA